MNPTLSKTNFEISTDAYKGPFDIVLDLVEERKLLVNELALASITDAFIQHVRAQINFPVEETATFIQIAATLLLIKSKSLIPDLELSADEEGDIKDLELRLAAYEKVRDAARELARIFDKAPLYAIGERAPEVLFAPSRDLNADALGVVLARVLTAREEVETLPEARVKPMISIEEMMDTLAKRVEQAMNLSFREFSKTAKDPSTGLGAGKIEIIVSFLALLELVKQGAVAAEQFERHGDIRIFHSAPAGVPRYG